MNLPRSMRTLRGHDLLLPICVVLGVFLSIAPAWANNIQITNLVVHPHSGGNGEVEFDITWENSWRVTTSPANWDAAWVFCKLRRNGGDWTHLRLNTTGHTIPSTPHAITTALGLVDTNSAHNSSSNPAVGIFLYRTNAGSGIFTANDVRLQWSYSDNGASSSDTIEIRVMAIEMVYVPQAAFSAGDYATSTSAFRQKDLGDVDPWYISSEGAITTTDGVTGDYFYPGAVGGDSSGTIFTIPADFPKGYRAFYIMKGEISQGQFVAFFNTLTATQKSARDNFLNKIPWFDPGNHYQERNNVLWSGSGEATLPDRGGGATNSAVAMGYLTVPDLIAYLDWAGLRPMSELEYEKACRGTSAPVMAEYAWATTSFTPTQWYSDDGLPSERGQTGAYGGPPYANDANAVIDTPSYFFVGDRGPGRVGNFAKAVASRTDAGASFYGVHELSGNLFEFTVGVGESEGRSFSAYMHGDGVLTSAGDQNVTSWPPGDDPNTDGWGRRGGSYLAAATYARVSDRDSAAFALADGAMDDGGRGVRTAP